MNLDTLRKIDRRLGPLICRILSLVPVPAGKTIDPGRVRRIMVVLLSEMGSLILACPMVQRLKEKFPEAVVEIVTFQRNIEIIEVMALASPEDIHAIRDDSAAGFIKDSLKFARQCRRQRPDMVIDCELFSRISSIYSFFSGAPVRAGFYRYTQEGLYRGGFINRPVLYNPYLHISRQFLSLAEAVDAVDERPCGKRLVVDDPLIMPRVKISAEEKKAMTGRIKSVRPGLDMDSRPLVILHPGGGLLPIRAWPIQYYGRVAESLTAAGFCVAVTGPAADGALAGSIIDACAGRFCVDLTGFTRTIRELLTVFTLARLLITNDGGPGLLAEPVSLPGIIIYGPETPVLYGSLSDKAVNLFAGCACSPCLTAYNHRNTPCDGDNVCLRSIAPETVVERALAILDRDKTR